MREVEDADKTGERLVLDVCEDRGADCAHEEIVGAPCKKGRVVEGLNCNVVPLSENL